MPIYEYKSMDINSEPVTGLFEAPDPEQLYISMKAQNVTVYSYKENTKMDDAETFGMNQENYEVFMRILKNPDVIMIGETRDNETAMISARAAITGHLVVSTLHTNDALSTIVRLRDMEVENYLISSALAGVVAQRLVRKICPHCKMEYQLSELEKDQIGMNIETAYKGAGCHICMNTGYKGRQSIHEVVEIDPPVKKMINDMESIENIYAYLKETKGMKSLKDNMKELVLSGVTTTDEYIRITYNV